MDIEGQSLIEFLLSLPILIGLVALLTRAVSAMQMSIVSQKYARGQALYIAGNSPVYPSLRFRSPDHGKDLFTAPDTMVNEMVLGVRENLFEAGEETGGPVPQSQAISRNELVNRFNDEGEDPLKRSKIRIFNTVTLCTQNNVILEGSQAVPGSYVSRIGNVLSERSRFDFCRGHKQ